MPLAYICRYNFTWMEVAAALVARGMEEEGQPGSSSGSSAGKTAAAAAAAGGLAGRGQGVRLFLSAYNPKTRRIEFLEDRVMDLYRFW
jgi:predicted acylesterase/phospholipase RssA